MSASSGGAERGRARLWLALAAPLLLSACAYVPPVATPEPGFLYGLLHGFIALFTMVLSFFTEVEMYAAPNGGPWYDLGFVLGFLLFAGGGAGSRRRRR